MIEINQCIGEPLHVMRRMIETKNFKHPVLWDDECRNTKDYGIKSWPFAYLIGKDGKVFWEGNPSRWLRRPKKVKEMRALIETKLAESVRTNRMSPAQRTNATSINMKANDGQISSCHSLEATSITDQFTHLDARVIE